MQPINSIEQDGKGNNDWFQRPQLKQHKAEVVKVQRKLINQFKSKATFESNPVIKKHDNVLT